MFLKDIARANVYMYIWKYMGNLESYALYIVFIIVSYMYFQILKCAKSGVFVK